MKGRLRQLCWIFASALAAYAGVCCLARCVSTRLLFPAPRPSYTVALPGFCRIPNPQGQTFAAVFLPNARAKYLVIFFHGNGEDLGIDRPRLADFQAAGFAVLAVDYPGYGLTGGLPSEEGLYASAEAAYRYATDSLRWAGERVIVYGLSLGGAAATWVASHEPVGAIVLESTFASAYRVFTHWPLLVGDRMPNLARIRSVRCPVLVLHGESDQIIGIDHARRLFAAAPEPKRFFPVRGAGHCAVPAVAGRRYWDELTAFVASLPP